MEVSSKDDKVQIELEGWEPHWLVSMLLHAKLCDDPKSEIWGHPMIIQLLKELNPFHPDADSPLPWEMSGGTVGDETGVQAPSSFYIMESRIKNRVSGEEFEREFADAIFPWALNGELKRDVYIELGRRVRLPLNDGTKQEDRFGIVIKSWPKNISQDFKRSDYHCFVAIEEDSFYDPTDDQPKIECYASSELTVVA